MYSVDIYSRVRRACLKDGDVFAGRLRGISTQGRKTIAKMLRHALDRPVIGVQNRLAGQCLMRYVGVIIDQILRTDKALIKKQRHTGQAHL